ncbi:putative YphP/YqiW family bacilliredoxin [Caldalkalibacillus uzonensis]|uniref:YphP/YqiW family bacilliredoxin n=1 Tax=Caldalkalibacillus uzonensis TaxID=353224 RepID=A0ABU0CLR7_9BACI|nr:BrxA/BrxB family bacilliredoxin [Caldalkalibacillus uzonensis]MDQ0337355.1 putative YphP/YqiW family bacilliredoxin [Caldalkalibacillus uzonensis]
MNMFFQNQMDLMIRPMREELTRHGFVELKTPEEVDEAFQSAKGVALVVVNSVCGCAAGLARPAAVHSLNYDKKPDHLFTVFAGQEKEATARAREYFEGYPPSSPSFAVLKDGKIVGIVQRHEIEDNDMESIIAKLHALYDKAHEA